MLLALIFIVADFLHPVYGLAVVMFQDGYVCHRCRWSRTVPMFLARRAPDDIARPDFSFQSSVAFDPTTAGGNDQRLSERVRVPCCSSTGLEGDTNGEDACGLGRLRQRVNPDGSGEVLIWPLARRLGPVSLDLHFCDSPT